MTSTDKATASVGTAVAEPGSICYLNGEFLPLAEAKVSIMTHAFMYGTACFEGIRAYWNAEQGQLWALRVEDHFRRLADSSKVLLMDLPGTPRELTDLCIELLRRNGYREDAYIRPSTYKSSLAIGVKLHGLDRGFCMLTQPFGDYIDTAVGIRTMTASWRRTSDQAIPARAKIVGAYVNSAFAKSEAMLNGFDEAIVLTMDGHVSEGSAENLFMVRRGEIITPSVSDDILEGITRGAIIELAAKELGLRVVERQIDRTELYIADEIFLCGTGAQVSPVREIDHRPVGDGGIGPVTARIKDAYFDAVRGRLPAYRDWLLPVY